MGIIDYFQLYNKKKMAEKYIKKTINLNFNLQTSSESPNVYADRFIDYFRGILELDFLDESNRSLKI